ncbi:MAG: hypothetical protein ACEB74_02000 [Desulfovibrio aminophilus]|uniref:hypothetical protein n=1 Tax=Desulfovibrio aminophilus TaxID=81425 RepID=UPI0039E903D9
MANTNVAEIGGNGKGPEREINSGDWISETYQPLEAFQEILLCSGPAELIPVDGWLYYVGLVLRSLLNEHRRDMEELVDRLEAPDA